MPVVRRRVALAGLLGGVFAAGLVVASVTVVLAQPRKTAPPARAASAAKPKATASASSDNPYDERASSSAPASSASSAPPSASAAAPASTSAGSTSAMDAGPVAPPPALSSTAGALSPLNPAPNEFGDAGTGFVPVDYDRLLADVASLRARVAAISDTLFHSKLAITVETSGDHGRIASMTVSIDDGIVWTSPPSFRADDATLVYEHAVAPGHHAITVDVERRDDRDDTYRSTQRSRFVVDVPNDQRLVAGFKLWDDSNIGNDFRNDRQGQYELRVRMRVQAQASGR